MMTPYHTLIFVLLLSAAYLLGSVPWGLVFTRMFTQKDIRQQGSGNIGATNVRRIAGPLPGILTLAADMAKGAVPVLLFMAAVESGPAKGGWFTALVALAAFMGHLYPCFLRFKGGKGVATAAGCFLVMAPGAFLTAILVFVAVVIVSNRVSAGSLSAAAVLPPTLWWMGEPAPFAVAAGVIAVFVFWRHKENISRLMAGNEPPFREKK